LPIQQASSSVAPALQIDTQSVDQPTDADGNPLPASARARLGSLRFRPGGGTGRLALAPDGKLLATGGSGNTIRLLDATSGKELRRIGPFSREPLSIAFSPDGKTMVVAAYGSALYFWDTATAKEVRRLETRQTWLCAVAYSPDGAAVASGGHESTIGLWNAKTGAELRSWEGPTGGVRQLTFSPDGKFIASVSATRVVQLWDGATGKELVKLKPIISAVSFSPDSKVLVTANDAQ
jgi:WD40 repeat protein